MSRRAKILVVIGCVAFAGAVMGVFYQKEIRIAYHRNRMWAAAENLRFLGIKPGRTVVPKLDGLRILLFRMTEQKEQEAVQHHEKFLLTLGYLEKREFCLTNGIFTGWSNVWSSEVWTTFQRQVANVFDIQSHWCTYSFRETNKFVVTATPADMPKWEKLISDFDKK